MLAIPINQDNSPEAVVDILFKLKVREVMTHPILTAHPSETLRSIQQVMKQNHITGMPIADDNDRLLGIVSMDDVITALDNGWIGDAVGLHMTTNVIVLQDTMSLSLCVSYFNKYSFGRFPVLDKDSRLVGIVTASDVVSTLLVALNGEVERLGEKPAHSRSGDGRGFPRTRHRIPDRTVQLRNRGTGIHRHQENSPRCRRRYVSNKAYRHREL